MKTATETIIGLEKIIEDLRKQLRNAGERSDRLRDERDTARLKVRELAACQPEEQPDHVIDVAVARIARDQGWTLPDTDLIEFGATVYKEALRFRPSAPAPQPPTIEQLYEAAKVVNSGDVRKDLFALEGLALHRYHNTGDSKYLIEALDCRVMLKNFDSNFTDPLQSVAPSGSAGPEPHNIIPATTEEKQKDCCGDRYTCHCELRCSCGIVACDECMKEHLLTLHMGLELPKWPTPPAEPSAEAKRPITALNIEFEGHRLHVTREDVGLSAEPAVVSASPEPICRICHWRKNYHTLTNGLLVCPTNGPFNNPLLTFELEAAAQPVAADLSKEVMTTDNQQTSADSATSASSKTSGLADLPKVEEAISDTVQEIVERLTAYGCHRTIEETINKHLRPYFQGSQTPQMPDEPNNPMTGDEWHCQECTDRIRWNGQQWIHDDGSGTYPHCTRAKSVAPVSGNGPEPPRPQDLFKREWSDDFSEDMWNGHQMCAFAESYHKIAAGAASHNGQGWVSQLKQLRDDGWMVAVHNDYRHDGKHHTFWLFTRVGREGQFVKGEGETDADALQQITRQLASHALPAPPSEANGPQGK